MRNLHQIVSLSVLILVIFGTQLTAQITTQPAFPTLDRSVTIIFNAAEGSRGLAGFTGDVYAHTGVLTNLSATTSSWRYVKTGWGVNTPANKMERIGTDLYSLTIPDIRAYYNVPVAEEILQLAFVFRSATTVAGVWREGKSATGGDLFVQIYEAGVFARFESPSTSLYSPSFVPSGAEVAIRGVGLAEGSTLTKLELFVDGTSVKEVSDSDEIEFTVTASASGRTDLMLVAYDNFEQTDTARTYFVVTPQTPRVARPTAIEDGITYHSDGQSVTFSMFAPGKEFVYVIGDFTDWQVRSEYLMNLHEVRQDSAHFWLTIDGLTPNTEYGFQYLVEGNLRIPDLFSEKILDQGLDRFISPSVYPNLMPYPSEKTQGVVTVIKPGRTPYVWQTTGYERPPQDQLIVYELLLRDFVQESTFDVLRDTLGYLERLGINAIELMPVSNFDGNLSWGYNPNFHGALDKSYGTRESFKRFVDAAHSRGMAVILDVVYNHTQEKSPLVALYGPNLAENRFLGPGHAYNVFRHLNHDDPYVRYWLDRMNRYWMETYKVDGYRFDLTKGFAPNVGGTNNSLLDGYNAQRIFNLKRMADRIWDFDQNAYIIFEHFAANSEELELANYRSNDPNIKGIMFWNNLNHVYNEATMGYMQNSNFAGVYYRNRGGWTRPNLISYMESHDEQWLMLKNRKFGNSSSTYSVRDVPTALKRMEMAGAFFFTVPGPKMMWQFGELGYGGGPGECVKPGGSGDGDCLPGDPGRTSEKPIRWDYYDDENRQRLYKVWASLIHLRREHAVFNAATTNVTMNVSATVKQIQLAASDMHVTIVGNFGVTEQAANVNFNRIGTWYNYFNSGEVQISSTSVPMTLQPGEYHIFTTVSLPAPDISVGTSITPEISDQPVEFALYQNYPNPFNPTTTIRYALAESGYTELAIYDLLGRKVSSLVSEMMPSGAHAITFDGSNLSSGVYLIRLQSGGKTSVQKMTLMK
jgi:1,4-alpha-glucan branching enzyme